MSLEQSLPGRLRSDNDIARLNGPVAGTPGANIDLQAWKTLPKEASDTAEATHLPDIAADLFLEADEDSEAELQAKDAAVRKKLDWIIVPIVGITHALQFLNKMSLNYAAAYGLIADVGLEGHRYSWVASIFNFGFLFWSIPTNLIIQRVPIGKYTGANILIWSLLMCCHAAVTNYSGMLAIRFILGMFEAGIAPSAMNIISMWYPRDEAPFRMCIVLGFNGLAAMVGALLGFSVGHVHDVAIHPWQLIFIVIGGMNFVWGIVFLLIIPDTPKNARFLSHKEKVVATWRSSKSMVGIKTKEFKPKQAVEALCDFNVWCTTLLGATAGIIIGGVGNFATSLIKGFGFPGIIATLLQLPMGAIAFVMVPLCGFAATYFGNFRCLTVMLISLPPLGALIGIRLTSLDHRWALLGCSWLQLLVLALIVLSWTILTANVGGHTKRSVANGMWFLFFGAGNIGGANLFFAREAPRYFSAITALIICYGVTILTAASLWIYMTLENGRRNRKLQESGKPLDGSEREAILQGVQDRTDRESQGFRYAT